MNESEMAKQIKRAVDAGDKFIQDIKNNTSELLSAINDLRRSIPEKEDEEEESE